MLVTTAMVLGAGSLLSFQGIRLVRDPLIVAPLASLSLLVACAVANADGAIQARTVVPVSLVGFRGLAPTVRRPQGPRPPVCGDVQQVHVLRRRPLGVASPIGPW